MATTERLTIRLDTDLAAELRADAKEYNASISEIIRRRLTTPVPNKNKFDFELNQKILEGLYYQQCFTKKVLFDLIVSLDKDKKDMKAYETKLKYFQEKATDETEDFLLQKIGELSE
jgi:hypothetical protein